MRKLLDIVYCKSQQQIDMYLPDNDGFSAVIWFHGGGIESGSRNGDDIPYGLVDKNIAVFSADYRMYPSAKYPDFIKDAADAVAFAVKKAKELGSNGKLFVGGSSAGAYITMMLCLNKTFLKNAGVIEDTDITAFISDSAQLFTHFNVLKEMGLDSRIEHICDKAPIYYVNDSLTLRPLLMFYYSDDMVCRPEESRLFYASLKRFLPQSPVTLTLLEGTHCSASCTDKNGVRRIEKYLEEYINNF